MSKLPFVVDAHTHLFNARYVPLQGFLKVGEFGKYRQS